MGGPSAAGQIVTDHRTKDWEFLNYGSSRFGGSLGADAEATRSYVSFPSGPPSPSNYDSAAGLYSDVKIFGNTYEAARLGATAENQKYTLSAGGATLKPNYQAKTTIFLRLAGFEVWNANAQGVTLSHTWSQNLGPYNTPTASFFFMLGIVPFTASVYAGASASVSLTATADLASVALELAGHAEATVYGVSSFGVGISVLSAGLQGTLKFGNPVIDPTLTAGLFTGLDLTLDVCMTNVIFILKAYASVGIWKLKKTWTWDIDTWTSPQVCESFVL